MKKKIKGWIIGGKEDGVFQGAVYFGDELYVFATKKSAERKIKELQGKGTMYTFPVIIQF